MNNAVLSLKKAGAAKSPNGNAAPQYTSLPPAPFSAYCRDTLLMDRYRERNLLEFHRHLPKHFLYYLESHKYVKTVGDLLKLSPPALLRSNEIGYSTVIKLIYFLNNIDRLDEQDVSSRRPYLIPGTDLRSCFNNPGELFDQVGNLNISVFDSYLPIRFFNYLRLHPELVTINDLLDVKTDTLIGNKYPGKITHKKLLEFLLHLKDFKLVPENNRTGIEEVKQPVRRNEPFKSHEIIAVYSGIIDNFRAHLREKEAIVFQSRFGKWKTLAETGREFGLTRERIRQIIYKNIEILKSSLSCYETVFKDYILQMLPEMSDYIDQRIQPPAGMDKYYFINILSHIYPSLPTNTNRLLYSQFFSNKYFARMFHRMMEMEPDVHHYTFKSLCEAMQLEKPDDIMNLYRILLCGYGLGFEVEDGNIYLTRTNRGGRSMRKPVGAE